MHKLLQVLIIFFCSIVNAQVVVGIPKKTNYIDTTRFNDVPYNCVGSINHGTYHLKYNADSITGDVELGGGGKHLYVALNIGNDSLSGTILNHSKYDLRFRGVRITGKVVDLRPLSAKMNKTDPLYGHRYELMIGDIPLKGLVVENENRDIEVNLRLGNMAYKGLIYTANRFLYYDLKIGANLILGKRDLATTECWWYIGRMDSTGILAFLFVDILFRDLRYLHGLGKVETPF